MHVYDVYVRQVGVRRKRASRTGRHCRLVRDNDAPLSPVTTGWEDAVEGDAEVEHQERLQDSDGLVLAGRREGVLCQPRHAVGGAQIEPLGPLSAPR